MDNSAICKKINDAIQKMSQINELTESAITDLEEIRDSLPTRLRGYRVEDLDIIADALKKSNVSLEDVSKFVGSTINGYEYGLREINGSFDAARANIVHTADEIIERSKNETL